MSTVKPHNNSYTGPTLPTKSTPTASTPTATPPSTSLTAPATRAPVASRGPSGSPPPPRTIVPSFAPHPAVTAPPATPAGPNRDGYVNYATPEPYSEPHAESSYPAAQTYGGSGGGLFSGLGNLGKYGGVMAPVLLATGLLFLFPSVKNITSTSSRRRRDLAAPEDESTDRTRDLVERLQVIYASLDEDDLCTSRLFCQLGEVIADSPDPARIIRYMDFFYPSKDLNMKIMEKAAYAEDPKCHLLECDTSTE
ncbi:proline-rich receptor-like protein kinase PERK2 [Pollicipes pollicipes]|uniref:proline-rich receptor-like protein kinase PERK2 n=1 Tax=Pollicipes pollicipes TaxID=41117 RepID=UPI001884E722|nr:proline-rich receptor-like protein kinase PERK2 [Pollicipes pollicipes]